MPRKAVVPLSGVSEWDGAIQHERWAEAITAIVVPAPGARLDERELLSRVRAHLDPYKVPKAVITVAELPRTSTGKIQKNVLRDRYARYYEQGTDLRN